MSHSSKRWTVQDRYGNAVYLTQERWEHIVDATNHPEMENCEEHLKRTIQRARRRQEPLNPRKHRYSYPFDDLPEGFNHVVAIVLFGLDMDERGQVVANNFVATAFLKHMRTKG